MHFFCKKYKNYLEIIKIICNFAAEIKKTYYYVKVYQSNAEWRK